MMKFYIVLVLLVVLPSKLDGECASYIRSLQSGKFVSCICLTLKKNSKKNYNSCVSSSGMSEDFT